VLSVQDITRNVRDTGSTLLDTGQELLETAQQQLDGARERVEKEARKPRRPSRRARVGRLALIAIPVTVGGVVAVRRVRSATVIQESIEAGVPVRVAYDQWTQFEEFPKFMEGVDEVRQIDDTHLHWMAGIGGRRREWDARIIEQIADSRIAWESVAGTPNGGVVTFHPMGENRTMIVVAMDHQADRVTDVIGTVLGLPKRRVRRDLERFRDLVERRGTATGAWRSEVRDAMKASA
jgi:uncharacterized membrane protein